VIDLDATAGMRVLFVGETIVDVYHYGRLLGRATKEPIIVLEQLSTEIFTGGVVAAANHARSFCARVDTISNRRVRKVRWLDTGHMRKLFEVYYEPQEMPQGTLNMPIGDYDAVIVTDYGHGMIDSEMIGKLMSKARFLAVNVQTNAGNYGFSLATKYHDVDYLCMDELEARLATHNQHDTIEESLKLLSRIAPKVVITLGGNGAIATGGLRAPAFTDRIIDTMGAGDAFFAVTALFAKDSAMPELLRIGNAAAALKCQILGHRAAVTKGDLIAYLETH